MCRAPCCPVSPEGGGVNGFLFLSFLSEVCVFRFTWATGRAQHIHGPCAPSVSRVGPHPHLRLVPPGVRCARFSNLISLCTYPSLFASRSPPPAPCVIPRPSLLSFCVDAQPKRPVPPNSTNQVQMPFETPRVDPQQMDSIRSTLAARGLPGGPLVSHGRSVSQVKSHSVCFDEGSLLSDVCM